MTPARALTFARMRWIAWTPERHPRLARAKYSAATLAIVVIAFALFRATAVPLIEPPRRAHNKLASTDTGSFILPALEAQRKRLAVYFEPGDWELDGAKVLETAQGMLILKDYRNLEEEGRVEIRPCTVLLLPDENPAWSDEERARRAVIMRAPEGAVLQFDKFDLRAAQVGNFVGGQLKGDVTVHSRQRDAGPEDDLLIRTRDVQLHGNRVLTDAPVEFQLAGSYGSGRVMRIELLPNKKVSNNRGPNFAGIRSFQLVHDVRLHLAMSSGKVAGANEPAAARAPASKSEPPFEITSRGPCRFDAERYVATFEDHVDVLQVYPEGPSDQMLCQTLAVYFAPRQEGNSPPGKPGKLPKLEPARLEASGSPLIVHAPSKQVEARGELLTYNLKTRTGSLRAARPGEEVRVWKLQNEIHARELHFAQPGPDKDSAQFLAIGPGWMRGTLPEQPDQPLEARWSDRALLRPNEGFQVLSAMGRAYVKSFAMGDLAADEIHAWMIPGVKLPDGKTGRPTPHRMLAAGNVKFDCPQVTGDVQRLEVWFLQPDASPAVGSAYTNPMRKQGNAEVRDREEALAGGGFDAPSPAHRVSVSKQEVQPAAYLQTPPVAAVPMPRSTTANGPPVQHFNVTGERLSMQVILEEPKARVKEMLIEQSVRVVETRVEQSGEKPLVLAGERVHVVQSAPQQALATITGNPAHVAGRGLAIESAEVRLDQGTNRLWTEGPGQMDLAVDRDLEGNPLPAPRPLKVTWRGGLDFDGLVARFRDRVEARQEHQLMRSDQLDVTMQRRVDFAKSMSKERGSANRGTGPIEVASIDCRGNVYLHQYSYQDAQLVGFRVMRSRGLRVDQLTGDILVHGPGSVQDVGLGSANPLDVAPSTATPHERPTISEASSDSKLNYLGVEFAESATGNLQKKTLTFHEQVRAVYGPVADWNSTLDADRPEKLPEDAFVLTTDALTVRQGAMDPSGKPLVELEALGDTRVESQKFDAWASRLTYAQGKELITLEGDAFTDAQIDHVARVGDRPQTTRAGKILYSRTNQRVTVQDFRHIDFNQLGTAPGERKK